MENEFNDATEKAITGNVDAQVRLAQFYQKGIFTAPQDFNKAITWFRIAANNGSKIARDILCIDFDKGCEDVPLPVSQL